MQGSVGPLATFWSENLAAFFCLWEICQWLTENFTIINREKKKIYFLLLVKIVGHIMNALRAPEQDLDAGKETDAKAESTEAAEV